jgi:hypothetical protein
MTVWGWEETVHDGGGRWIVAPRSVCRVSRCRRHKGRSVMISSNAWRARMGRYFVRLLKHSLNASLSLLILALIVCGRTSISHADERPRNVTIEITYPTVSKNPNTYPPELNSRNKILIYFGSDGTAYSDVGGSQGVVLPPNLNSNTRRGTYEREPGKRLYDTDYLEISGPFTNFKIIANTDSFGSWVQINFHIRSSFVLNISGLNCTLLTSTVNVWEENNRNPQASVAAGPGPKTCQILPGRHLSQ